MVQGDRFSYTAIPICPQWTDKTTGILC